MSKYLSFPRGRRAVWLALLGVGLVAVVAGRPALVAPSAAPNGVTLVAVVKGDSRGMYTDPVPEPEDTPPPRPRAGVSRLPLLSPTFSRGARPPSRPFIPRRVGRGDPGGAGIWVRLGPPFSPDLRNTTAAGPRGEALPVQVGFQQQGLYLLTLPGGYPTGYGPVTLTLTDTEGHSAPLRVTNLPPSFHAIPGRPKISSAFHQDGLTMTVHAYRAFGPPAPSSGPPFWPRRFPQAQAALPGIGYDVWATYPAGTEWKLNVRRAQLEWEALPPDQTAPGAPLFGYTEPVATVAPFGTRTGINPEVEASPEPRRRVVRTVYGAYNHYLRLDGDVEELASMEEKVTFHNLTIRAFPSHTPGNPPSYAVVAAPQTEVTPSGIFVSLRPLPNYEHLPANYSNSGPLIQMRLTLGPPPLDPHGLPGRFLTALPHSPLAQKYHHPVRFTLRAADPHIGVTMGPITDPADPRAFGDGYLTILDVLPTVVYPPQPWPPGPPPTKLLYAGSPSDPPKFLPSLTLLVTQETEVKTTPAHFLVPITGTAPQ